VLRTRSPRRALLGLASYLSSHLPSGADRLMRTSSPAVLIDGRAVILPVQVQAWRDQLRPRLAKVGARVVDGPQAVVDPDAWELVVPQPAVPMDPGVLDELSEPPSRRSEPPMVEPGRHPLSRWAVWRSEGSPEPTPAQVVTRALSSCLLGEETFGFHFEVACDLYRRGLLASFVFRSIDELVDRLRDFAEGLGAASERD
jgi:hypothetical protein